MNLTTFFAFDPADTEEIRLEKFAIFLLAGSCCIAGCIWAAMYYLIFGWGLTTMLPILFVIIVGSSLFVAHVRRNHHYAIYAQIICIMYITALIQWSIGGAFDSGLVLVWAFCGPICALIFFSLRQSAFWFLNFLMILGITVAFDGVFASHSQVVSENTKLFFLAMNVGFSSAAVFVFASYYVNAAISEREKANRLLRANLQQRIMLQQSEKLATLGRLSAGVAHELNNPAAAAQRGADHLQDALAQAEKTAFGLGQLALSASQVQVLERQRQIIDQRSHQPIDVDPLARSDREYEVETWLEERGIADAWEVAPLLVNLGYGHPELSRLAEDFGHEALPMVIALLGNSYAARNMLEEIRQGTGQIAEIVKALKSYSYLDQAPMQSIDVHEGLEDTLVMLRSKLRPGVQVRREYAQNLPRIEAYGSELNQVWTNIIDNAISAMEGQGELVLRTYRRDPWVVVEIRDTGPGIPDDIQNSVFDPFFTTKPPGEGTGLGLNISHNIVVQKHRGEITVSSEPGETCFEVRLPLNAEDL